MKQINTKKRTYTTKQYGFKFRITVVEDMRMVKATMLDSQSRPLFSEVSLANPYDKFTVRYGMLVAVRKAIAKWYSSLLDLQTKALMSERKQFKFIKDSIDSHLHQMNETQQILSR